MALCNIAGIGGGGIANPMLQLFFLFSTKSAVAVSSFTILACSLLRLGYNWRDRHPEKKNNTMVDYSLATIMMPTTLCGSQIGTYVLLASPPILIDIMLTLLLFLLGLQSARKGVQLHKKENAAFAEIKRIEAEKLAKGEENDSKDKEYWGVYGTPIAGGANRES